MRRAGDMGAHTRVDMVLAQRNAGSPGVERVAHGGGVITQTGNDAGTSDDHAFGHYIDSVFWNRPTLRSEAV